MTPAPGAGAIAVSHGERSTRKVALTFDMGDRLDPADRHPRVADRERASRHRSSRSARRPRRRRAAGPCSQLAAARPDLFDIGNLHLGRAGPDRPPGAARSADQLNRAEAAISTFANVTTKPWFRPPDGAWDDDVRTRGRRRGLGVPRAVGRRHDATPSRPPTAARPREDIATTDRVAGRGRLDRPAPPRRLEHRAKRCRGSSRASTRRASSRSRSRSCSSPSGLVAAASGE